LESPVLFFKRIQLSVEFIWVTIFPGECDILNAVFGDSLRLEYGYQRLLLLKINELICSDGIVIILSLYRYFYFKSLVKAKQGELESEKEVHPSPHSHSPTLPCREWEQRGSEIY
jgi:hypothetical protein